MHPCHTDARTAFRQEDWAVHPRKTTPMVASWQEYWLWQLRWSLQIVPVKPSHAFHPLQHQRPLPQACLHVCPPAVWPLTQTTLFPGHWTAAVVVAVLATSSTEEEEEAAAAPRTAPLLCGAPASLPPPAERSSRRRPSPTPAPGSIGTGRQHSPRHKTVEAIDEAAIR